MKNLLTLGIIGGVAFLLVSKKAKAAKLEKKVEQDLDLLTEQEKEQISLLHKHNELVDKILLSEQIQPSVLENFDQNKKVHILVEKQPEVLLKAQELSGVDGILSDKVKTLLVSLAPNVDWNKQTTELDDLEDGVTYFMTMADANWQYMNG